MQATKETRDKLIARKAELERRINALETDIRRGTGGPLSEDSEEAALEQENDEVLDALDDQTRLELGQVVAALDRIASGKYGFCEKCGQPIGPERLEALPYAVRCIRCA